MLHNLFPGHCRKHTGCLNTEAMGLLQLLTDSRYLACFPVYRQKRKGRVKEQTDSY